MFVSWNFWFFFRCKCECARRKKILASSLLSLRKLKRLKNKTLFLQIIFVLIQRSILIWRRKERKQWINFKDTIVRLRWIPHTVSSFLRARASIQCTHLLIQHFDDFYIHFICTQRWICREIFACVYICLYINVLMYMYSYICMWYIYIHWYCF